MNWFSFILIIALSASGMALSIQNRKLKQKMAEYLKDAEDAATSDYMEGFRLGWDQANKDAVNVRQAYETLFGKK